MTEQATQEGTGRKARTKVFGRSYNHAGKELKIDVIGQPEASRVASLASLPESVRDSFALMALADFIVGGANSVINDGGTKEDAIKQVDALIADAVAGKVEFTSGLGLGMSSAPATLLVGRALVDEGKKFVQWNGVRYDFEGDVSKAQEAMKTLYNNTAEVELPNKTKMTGRQFFRQISEIPAVAERVKSYKKAKGQSEVVTDNIG